MHGEWSPRELRAALAAMQDEGFGQSDIAKLAAVNRSQVNRWARGENRPTYDKALRLARRIGTRYPELAARLMAASGYAWDGRAEPVPEPDIPETLMAQIRQDLAPEDQAAVIEAIRQTLAGTTPPGAEDRSAARRRAG